MFLSFLFSHRRLKKTSTELTERMDSLSLDEGHGSVPAPPAEQRRSQMERIFSFPAADLPSFPHKHCQELMDQIQSLPAGITFFYLCLKIILISPQTLFFTSSWVSWYIICYHRWSSFLLISAFQTFQLKVVMSLEQHRWPRMGEKKILILL